jgi:ATP-dependent Clp protease ATP-binding subunit ClpA
MSLVTDRTQYLNLEQIEAACRQVQARLLVSTPELIDSLRRELTAVSAAGLRSSALGQGLFGAHSPQPGILPIAGPGGVGKTYFAELLARVIYGEHFADHLVGVNCRAYFAGRFPPLPRAKLERGPLTIVALDSAEVLAQVPPVAALWADAIRFGRAPLPVMEGSQLGPVQAELSFARCLIVATANVGRNEVAHIGFYPTNGHEGLDSETSSRIIRNALGELFEGDLAELLGPERWIILPPLATDGMRRLVDLQVAAVADLLPRNSPPVEITDPAAARLVHLAMDARSPNKTAALVERMQSLLGPAVNEALLRAAAPIPLRVQVTLEGGEPHVTVEPA